MASSRNGSGKNECKYIYTCTTQECIKNDLSQRIAKKFEFDLCNKMHFIGHFSLFVSEVSLKLKSTSHKFWKVKCECTSDHFPDVKLDFTSGERKKLFNDSYMSLRCNRVNCGLTTIKFSIYPSICETISKPIYPIETSQLKYEFSQLLETKKLSDVSFIVGNKEIHAHKCVLSCRSPVFEAMFAHPMKENLSNTVVIEDMESGAFEEMLRFIYYDEVPNLKKFASELLAASDKYNLPTLTLKCEISLIENLTIENAAKTFTLASLYGGENFRKRTGDFMKTNRVDVAKTPGFKELLNVQEAVHKLLICMFND